MHIKKICFAFSLLVFACANTIAGDNPFLTPSERKAASKPLDCPAQDISIPLTAESLAQQEEVKMLLNNKNEDQSASNKYVGSINGKDVYFNRDKKTYIYRDSVNSN